MESINLYTGGAAIAAPLPVLLILSLPMAGQREELYSLKGATVPYRYAILTFMAHWVRACPKEKCVLWASSLGARAPLSMGRAC